MREEELLEDKNLPDSRGEQSFHRSRFSGFLRVVSKRSQIVVTFSQGLKTIAGSRNIVSLHSLPRTIFYRNNCTFIPGEFIIEKRTKGKPLVIFRPNF